MPGCGQKDGYEEPTVGGAWLVGWWLEGALVVPGGCQAWSAGRCCGPVLYVLWGRGLALALLDKGGSRKGCGNKSILVRIGSYRWPRCADHVVHNVVVRVGLAGGGGLGTIVCCSASKPIREAKCCCAVGRQAPSPCGGRGVLARLCWLRGAPGRVSKEARCRGRGNGGKLRTSSINWDQPLW